MYITEKKKMNRIGKVQWTNSHEIHMYYGEKESLYFFKKNALDHRRFRMESGICS